MFCGKFVGNFPRAVGRIIVHDEQIHLDRQGQKLLRHAREIFPLIVSRHDDKCFVHAKRKLLKRIDPENKRTVQ
jgi:hypothetical protein